VPTTLAGLTHKLDELQDKASDRGKRGHGLQKRPDDCPVRLRLLKLPTDCLQVDLRRRLGFRTKRLVSLDAVLDLREQDKDVALCSVGRLGHVSGLADGDVVPLSTNEDELRGLLSILSDDPSRSTLLDIEPPIASERDRSRSAHHLHPVDEALVVKMLGGVEDPLVGNVIVEIRSDLVEIDVLARTITARARQRRGHGGEAGYGYRWKGRRGSPGDGIRVVVPEEAEVVRRIFFEYISGASSGSIAAGLHRDGTPSPSGTGWGPSHLSKLLRNRLYAGMIGEYRGLHDPIVSTEIWEAARRLRESRQTNRSGAGRRPSGSHLPTRGILRCTCGGSMVPRTYKRRPSLPEGGVVRLLEAGVYYGKDACPQPSLRRDEIDSAVLTFFENVGLDLEATREQFERDHQGRLAEARALRERAESDLIGVQARLDRLEADYFSGELSAGSYERLLAKTEDDHRAQEEEVARLTGREGEVMADLALAAATDETLEYLARIRAAVAGQITGAEEIDSLRAALSTLFEGFSLHRLDEASGLVWPELETGDYFLEPKLRAEVVLRPFTVIPDSDFVRADHPDGLPPEEAERLGITGPLAFELRRASLSPQRDFASGATSRYCRTNWAISAKTGPATTPPQIAPRGSSTVTRTTARGRLAGA
jgi:Recombinase